MGHRHAQAVRCSRVKPHLNRAPHRIIRIVRASPLAAALPGVAVALGLPPRGQHLADGLVVGCRAGGRAGGVVWGTSASIARAAPPLLSTPLPPSLQRRAPASSSNVNTFSRSPTWLALRAPTMTPATCGRSSTQRVATSAIDTPCFLPTPSSACSRVCRGGGQAGGGGGDDGVVVVVVGRETRVARPPPAARQPHRRPSPNRRAP